MEKIITLEMNFFPQVQNLFMSLVSPPFASPKIRKIFSKFFDELKGLKADRNELIHTFWMPGDTPGEIIATSATAKGQVKTPMRPWTAEAIKKVAFDIGTAANQFYDLYCQYGVTLPPLPDKPELRTD